MQTLRIAFVLGGLTWCVPAVAGAEEAVTLAEGRFGKALDARKAPVILEGNPRFGQSPLTIECWAKFFSKKNVNILLASDERTSSSHWEVYTAKDSGELALAIAGLKPADIRSGVNVCDGQWHHLAVVLDASSVRLFVDGRRIITQAVERQPVKKAVTGTLTVGGVLEGQTRLGCDGLIDEVRISGTAREPRELPAKPPAHDPQTILLGRFDRAGDFEADPAWTPKASTGSAANWEKATDKDWIDGRLREMDTGPFLNHTFEYPSWNGLVRAYKGTAIRIGDQGEGTVLFDRGMLRMAAGWLGPYLTHSTRRFGLLNTPRPAAELSFTTGGGPGWADRQGKWSPVRSETAPLAEERGRFESLRLFGKRVQINYMVGHCRIQEAPWLETYEGITAFRRGMHLRATAQPLRLWVCDLPGPGKPVTMDGLNMMVATRDREMTAVALLGANRNLRLEAVDKDRLELAVASFQDDLSFKLLIWHGPADALAKFVALVKASPAPEDQSTWQKAPAFVRWKEARTRGVVGTNDGPFAVDTLTLPYDNPHKALWFASGIDCLPNGDLAVCTAHGDVWIVSGVDDKLDKLTWRRFATGLYQPLGLVAVDDQILVLERGQLTWLRDLNRDGEADVFDCVCNHWDTGAGQHSFDTCLERGPDGSFYFFKTGDTQLPTGGCLMRVSNDGDKAEVFATGFRHPIGLGMSPDGMLTGADQEGNWMPSTRIDVYQKGGFYGDMRAHHRDLPPKLYDQPLLWLPREFDNSAGGQVWVPKGQWGALGGQMLHLSYGRCRAMLVMRQEVDGVWQGGAVSLPPTFLSGVMRGRFHPKDGHLYLVGLMGWQTAAEKDGCLQRVRYTGKSLHMPVGMSVHTDGLRIAFSDRLDARKAADLKSYRIEQWNYRWTAEYGSKRWSAADPERLGPDAVPLRSVTLAEDGRSVFLEIEGLKPVMQMQIHYDLLAADGQKVAGAIANTIHKTAR